MVRSLSLSLRRNSVAVAVAVATFTAATVPGLIIGSGFPRIVIVVGSRRIRHGTVWCMVWYRMVPQQKEEEESQCQQATIDVLVSRRCHAYYLPCGNNAMRTFRNSSSLRASKACHTTTRLSQYFFLLFSPFRPSVHAIGIHFGSKSQDGC